MTAADFNHDSHVDVALAISRISSGSIAVFLHVPMTGRGYQPRVEYGTVRGLDTITSGDVDGDGLPDIIAARADDTSNDVFALLNQTGAAGTFAAPQVLSADFVSRTAIADMNGDGRADLVLAAHALMLSLQAAGTPGTLAAPATLYTNPRGGSLGSLAVGDLNGDGLPDVAFADDHAVTVLFHGPATDPPAVGNPLDVFANTRIGEIPAIAIADLDGDGRNDLAITDPDGNSLVVLLQSHDMAGEFLPSARFGALPVDEGMAITVGDLNGDGRPDVVTGGSAGVRVFLQDPTRAGSYLASTNYRAPLTADGVAIADADEDARPDIITSEGASCPHFDNGFCKQVSPGVLY